MGMYDVFAADWLAIFPRSQMYFSKLEQFSTDPRLHLKEIFSFLDLGETNDLMLDIITSNLPLKNIQKTHVIKSECLLL